MSDKEGKKKRKYLATKREDLLELKRLEKIVLGKEHGFLQVIRDTRTEKSVADEKKLDAQDESKVSRNAAWLDEDDTKLEIPDKLKKYSTGTAEDSYQDLLRRQFQQTMGIPKWAGINKKFDKSTEEEEIDDLMRCGKMLDKKSMLPKGILKIEKMEDLNKETKMEGALINAVEFHPTATVALVAGISGVTSIIKVDGITNSKLQTVKFNNFRVDCAHFTHDGNQFIVGSKSGRSFFYYDMMVGRSIQIPMHHAIGPLNMSKFEMSPDGKLIVICGKYGTIHLLSAKTKEWIGDLKMNNNVVDVSFSSDGTCMFSYSDNGEIYEWDMCSRCYKQKMFDEGCVKGVTMTLSPSGQILAAGSTSGIVNLYEMPIKTESMAPVKVVKNLVTPITAMTFNKTSEILAVASNDKNNAVRLVHFPSMTVFSNFPGFMTIGEPRVLNFSPLSGFFAVGTSQKSVLLYRLKHYKNY